MADSFLAVTRTKPRVIKSASIHFGAYYLNFLSLQKMKSGQNLNGSIFRASRFAITKEHDVIEEKRV